MKPTLKDYQQDGVQFMLGVHGGILLADQMGTGKTAQVASLASQASLWPLLVVCPASIKTNWQRELRTWANVDSLVIEGKTASDLVFDEDFEMPPAVIINYDILSSHTRALGQIPWKCMALDECHMLANRASQRTRAARLLARKVTKVIGMSGTPVMNKPANFWPILNIIRPVEFASWHEYAFRYCDPKKTPWGWTYDGAKNLDDLHRRIQPFTLRRVKSDVLDLPEKTLTVVPMQLSPEALKELAEIEEGFVAEAKKSTDSEGRVIAGKKTSVVTGLIQLLGATARLKSRCVVDWARDFLAKDPKQKLVLFAHHKAMVDVLQRRVLDTGVVVINGDVPTKKRQAIVDQFQNDPETRLLVANIKAGGVGITLTAASTVAMAELWWEPGQMEQAADRVHRIGQTEVCDILYLIVPNSIEEKLAKALQTKALISNTIVDGRKENSLPVLDMLLQQTTGKTKKKGKN